MNTSPLPQPELDFTGQQLKERGCATVLHHNEPYKEQFFRAADRILLQVGKVTSEMVTDVIGIPPNGHPNAVGASMRSFAAKRKLKVMGYIKSARPSCHAAIIAVWA